MIKPSYKLGTVMGIPIRVHLTLVILLPVIASMLAPGTGLAALLFGLAIAVGLFASVALHELSHSAVALAYRCRVRQIMLLPIGGVAELQGLPDRPQAEFWITLAGPVMSGALWVLCDLIAAFFFTQDQLIPAALFANLGLINKMLALFNMIPAFPMDGGRILRSLLSAFVGRLEATEWASSLGRTLAIAFGLYCLIGNFQPFGIALAIFIYIAGTAEYRAVRIQHAQQQGITDPFGLEGFPGARQARRPTASEIVVGPPPYAKNARSESSPRTGIRRFF